MPRNPGGREHREWLSKVVALAYGSPIEDLSPHDQNKQLKQFIAFCTPETPKRGVFLTMVFRYGFSDRRKQPAPPTLRQLIEFQRKARTYLDMKFQGQRCVTGAGASANAEDGVVYFTSQNAVDAAMTRLNQLVGTYWKYVQRCPRADFPKERCRKVFVAKKLPEAGAEPSYCSRRCYRRIKKREEKHIPEERYGVSGPKPKEGT